MLASHFDTIFWYRNRIFFVTYLIFSFDTLIPPGIWILVIFLDWFLTCDLHSGIRFWTCHLHNFFQWNQILDLLNFQFWYPWYRRLKILTYLSILTYGYQKSWPRWYLCFITGDFWRWLQHLEEDSVLCFYICDCK